MTRIARRIRWRLARTRAYPPPRPAPRVDLRTLLTPHPQPARHSPMAGHELADRTSLALRRAVAPRGPRASSRGRGRASSPRWPTPRDAAARAHVVVGGLRGAASYRAVRGRAGPGNRALNRHRHQLDIQLEPHLLHRRSEGLLLAASGAARRRAASSRARRPCPGASPSFGHRRRRDLRSSLQPRRAVSRRQEERRCCCRRNDLALARVRRAVTQGSPARDESCWAARSGRGVDVAASIALDL